MRTIASWLAAGFLAAAINAAPFAEPALAAEFPLPEDLVLAAPAPEVPDEWAAFSGTWQGKWDHKAPMMCVVENVYPDGRGIVVYSWADYPPWDWRGGYERNAAIFKDGKMIFENRHGTYTHRMLDNGKMRSDFKGNNGVTGTAILTKKE